MAGVWPEGFNYWTALKTPISVGFHRNNEYFIIKIDPFELNLLVHNPIRKKKRLKTDQNKA
jgi:hypothetical protein